MDNNAQSEVPAFLAVPGLGVIMLKAWESEEDYLSSIADEYERLGMEAPDDCTADTDD